MDRERLQQVQQSDLGESRVNEDFVNWIKTSGPWYLLAVLIGIAVYMYIVNIQRAELRAREQAWFDFSEAVMPASLEDVANTHGAIDGIANLARLRAANSYLQSMQSNLAIGSTIEDGTPLSEEDRSKGMEHAAMLYNQVVDSDDGSFGDTIVTVNALNGLAALSESAGDIDKAKAYYEQSAARSGDWYPFLADQANQRAATADLYVQDITLPSPPAPAQPALPTFSTPGLTTTSGDNILNLPSSTTPPVEKEGGSADPVTP
ncbi:MAG: hypothetical protein P8J89_06440 [Phycisphaerales bacterium]|nr:hypothetical protein [Phycisphaerales bacterium]